MLVYADYSKPFKLQTEASELGFGAVLHQAQDEVPDWVIAYASRTLSNTESRYPAHCQRVVSFELGCGQHISLIPLWQKV